jgi:hypothetical protein
MEGTHDNIPIDDTFPRSYEIEWLADIPHLSTLPRHYIDQTADGQILRITAEGRQRIIIVKGGLGQLQLLTWPNPWCFFARPSEKLVDARDPESASALVPQPFRPQLIAVRERRLMLVYFNSVLSCFGQEGRLWTAELFLMKAFADALITGYVYLPREMHYMVGGADLTLQFYVRDRAAGDAPLPVSLNVATGQPR